MGTDSGKVQVSNEAWEVSVLTNEIYHVRYPHLLWLTADSGEPTKPFINHINGFILSVTLYLSLLTIQAG